MSIPLNKVDQQGQAIVEALIALVPLSLLLMVIPLIGKWQDLGLRAQHASRYMAFDAVQHTLAPKTLQPAIDTRFFAASSVTPNTALWVDSAGKTLRSAGADALDTVFEIAAEPGALPLAAPLMQAFDIPTEGVVVAKVVARTTATQWPRLGNWPALAFERRTAILRFAGEGTADNSVQSRLEQPSVYPGAHSQTLAAPLIAEMTLIDSGWQLRPGSAWLSPWTGAVPADRLQPVKVQP